MEEMAARFTGLREFRMRTSYSSAGLHSVLRAWAASTAFRSGALRYLQLPCDSIRLGAPFIPLWIAPPSTPGSHRSRSITSSPDECEASDESTRLVSRDVSAPLCHIVCRAPAWLYTDPLHFSSVRDYKRCVQSVVSTIYVIPSSASPTSSFFGGSQGNPIPDWLVPRSDAREVTGHVVAAIYSRALAALVGDGSRCVVQLGHANDSDRCEPARTAATPLYWHSDMLACSSGSAHNVRVASLQMLDTVTWANVTAFS